MDPLMAQIINTSINSIVGPVVVAVVAWWLNRKGPRP
jgi:plastocyanin domain-containing protein